MRWVGLQETNLKPRITWILIMDSKHGSPFLWRCCFSFQDCSLYRVILKSLGHRHSVPLFSSHAEKWETHGELSLRTAWWIFLIFPVLFGIKFSSYFSHGCSLAFQLFICTVLLFEFYAYSKLDYIFVS